MSRPAISIGARALARLAIRIAAGIIALHIVVQPVAALASSGWQVDSHCCCPDPEHCQCPDGNGGNDAPSLRACGNTGVMLAPLVIAMLAAPPAPALVAPRPIAAAAPHIDTRPSEHVLEPETPPF